MSLHYAFTLYVAGQTSRSEQAIANLRRLCKEALAGFTCEIAVVDVLTDPESAEERRILATPTLIKESPAPLRRITGDLSDMGRVLTGLALSPFPSGDAR